MLRLLKPHRILTVFLNQNQPISTTANRLVQESERKTEEEKTDLVKIRKRFHGFDQLTGRKDFMNLIDHLNDDISSKKRQNHVDIVYVALKSLKNLKLEKDLEVYKKVLNILPKGKYIPRNAFQAEFQHYPKQQQCAIDLLEQMEDNAVIPDAEMETMLLNIFGKRGYPLRKYWRMMYWMPKFKNASPFPLDLEFLQKFPSDPSYRNIKDDSEEDYYLNQLAMLTIKRIAGVDLTTEYFQKFNRFTFAITPTQIETFNAFKPDKWNFAVEGPFFTWYHKFLVEYFVLKGTPLEPLKEPEEQSTDDVDKIKFHALFSKEKPAQTKEELSLATVHNQEDGYIFSTCIVALQGDLPKERSNPEIDFNAGKVSLVREWISCLETEHKMNVAGKNLIFRIQFPEEEPDPSEETREKISDK